MYILLISKHEFTCIFYRPFTAWNPTKEPNKIYSEMYMHRISLNSMDLFFPSQIFNLIDPEKSHLNWTAGHKKVGPRNWRNRGTESSSFTWGTKPAGWSWASQSLGALGRRQGLQKKTARTSPSSFQAVTMTHRLTLPPIDPIIVHNWKEKVMFLQVIYS